MRKILFASALVLTAASVSDLAFADTAPEGPPHHDGWHHPPSPLMHVLHQLDLSDAQKASMKQLFEAERETMKPQSEAVHSARHAFNAVTPGDPAFAATAGALADAEASAARAHVQADADLRTKAYALLTDEQKAKLATLLAQAPAPDAPPPTD